MDADEAFLKRLDVDVWAPMLEGLTPAVHFFPLTVCEAKEVLKQCEHQQHQQFSTESFEQVPGRIASSPHLQELVTRIDEFLNSKPEAQNGFFVRLSKRSPKDATLRFPNVKDQFDAAIESVKSEGKDADLEQAIITVMQVTTDLLKVRNGVEVVRLLASSNRTFQDLTLEFLEKYSDDDYKNAKDQEFSQKLIFRPFVPEIRPELELRVFVNERAVTGISQYNHLSRVGLLAENSESVQRSVVEFVQDTILPRVPLKCFVIDVAITAMANGKATLLPIELNPFSRKTGGCLFDWNVSGDVAILENGPTEFRFTKFTDARSWKRGIAPEVEALLQDWFMAVEESTPKEKKRCAIC
eukprot:TRINITY_DN5433_c0_g1_i2.p1 TRINITY_DN5433_c0_g1~~TRINITY_DN5433_c0_g1_i2.p1  ORF type:complete len:355 (+),score=86.25 TRINITY_DN5433_c0_g1_i2:1764-2828(+)